MRKIFKYAAYAATAVLASVLVAGCIKNLQEGGAGNSIVFRASTSGSDEPATRTVYSGERSGTKEVIDWVVGDKIRIYSHVATCLDGVTHYADYSVTGLTGGASSNVRSYANLSPVNGNGLQWNGTVSHDFFCIYPAPVNGNDSHISFALGEGSKGTITHTIPAIQGYTLDGTTLKPDMNYAHMIGGNAMDGGSTTVNITCEPIITAFQFTIDSGVDATKTITSFTLTSSGKSLAGTQDVELLQSNSITFNSSVLSGSNVITVSFNGGSGITITKGNPITFTVFALPLTYGATDKLTASFTTSTGAVETLPLKDASGNWLTFQPGRKYNFNNLGLPGTAVLGSLEDVTVDYAGDDFIWTEDFTSYKPVSSSYNKPLSYSFQYKAYDSASGSYDADWTDGLPDWLTATTDSNQQGSATGEYIVLTVAPQVNSATDPHHTELAGRTAKSNFDLSTINVATGATVQKTTANCYVVQAPGTYKFPVIYGNAIVGGMDNPYAYRATTDGSTFRTEETTGYLAYFKSHNDIDITSPYIFRQINGTMSAKLLWTDVEGLVDNVSISGSGDTAYITFEVPSATITQGNALIAIMDNDKIAWSWHIWVTDEDLTQIKEGSNGYYFAPVNLGWCDALEEVYAERKCKVRIVQGGNTTLVSNEAVITQTGETIPWVGGNNPYYQWGRKDPLQASSGKVGYYGTGYNKTYYPSEPQYAPRNGVPGKKSIGEAIKTPYINYTHGNSTPYDWCSTTYYNTWNSRIDGFGSGQYSTPVVKTIYDPSPVGFKMPPVAAWEDFPTSNFGNANTYTSSISSAGVVGYGRKRSNGLFFPASGYRSSATVYYVWSNGCYWSAVPLSSYDNGYSLYFGSGNAANSSNRRSLAFAVRPVKE